MRLLLICLTAVLLGSCGRTVSAAQPTALPELASPAVALANLQRSGSAYSLSDRARTGAQYEPGLPNGRVSVAGGGATFSPATEGPTLPMGGLAYATYAFTLPPNIEEPLVRVNWDAPPGEPAYWYVALADWEKNSWHWVRGGGDGTAQFGEAPPDFARYRAPDGSILAVVALWGETSYEAASVTLGGRGWQHVWSWKVQGDEPHWTPECLAQASDGYVVLLKGGPNDGRVDHQHSCLVKYDSSGKVQWHKFFSSAGFDFYPSYVLARNNGEILLIQSFVAFESGIRFYKFDAAGNYLGGRSFLGDDMESMLSFDLPWRAIEDDEENIYITMRATLFTGGEERLAYAFGFDPLLNPIFSQQISEYGYEMYGLDSVNGGVYLCGKRYVGEQWNDTVVQGTLVCLNKDGAQRFGKIWTALPGSDASLFSLTHDSSGNLFVSGWTESSAAQSPFTSHGLLQRWDQLGNLQSSICIDAVDTQRNALGELVVANGSLFSIGAADFDAVTPRATHLFELSLAGELLGCTGLARLANAQPDYGTRSPFVVSPAGELALLGFAGDFAANAMFDVETTQVVPSGTVTDLPDYWVDYPLTDVGEPPAPAESSLPPLEDQLPAEGQAVMLMQLDL